MEVEVQLGQAQIQIEPNYLALARYGISVEEVMSVIRNGMLTVPITMFLVLLLLFVSGVGSKIQYPLSVVITGGIISSTLLTLLILPSTYMLFYQKEHENKTMKKRLIV